MPRGGVAAVPVRGAETLADGPYTLDAGDKLRIVVFGQDALSNNYTVDAARPGDAAADRRGEARGLTTAQLVGAIAGRLKRSFIRDPSVAVEIETYRPFFVLGEVTYPGQYPYVPNMTVENAIAIAGGFTPRASKDSVTSPARCRAARCATPCRCAIRCGPATPSKSPNAGSDFPPLGPDPWAATERRGMKSQFEDKSAARKIRAAKSSSSPSWKRAAYFFMCLAKKVRGPLPGEVAAVLVEAAALVAMEAVAAVR